MAGHSKFKNIMHRKGAQDKKRAKVFTRCAKEIIVAVKEGGADPDMNPRLRLAISNAKANNLPNDNIKRAIKTGSGEGDEAANFEEMRYEGYGPDGVAFIVEALTDNRNRTASELRSTFAKGGGNLGESNSVAFMFDRIGEVIYDTEITDADTMFEVAVEAGAENCESDEESHRITTSPDDFAAVQEALQKKFGDPKQAGLTWQPNVTKEGDEALTEKTLNLIEALEDIDDVQYVHTNYEMAED